MSAALRARPFFRAHNPHGLSAAYGRLTARYVLLIFSAGDRSGRAVCLYPCPLQLGSDRGLAARRARPSFRDEACSFRGHDDVIAIVMLIFTDFPSCSIA